MDSHLLNRILYEICSKDLSSVGLLLLQTTHNTLQNKPVYHILGRIATFTGHIPELLIVPNAIS